MVITSLANLDSRDKFVRLGETAILYSRKFLLRDPDSNDIWSRIHDAKMDLFGGNGDRFYDINAMLIQIDTPSVLVGNDDDHLLVKYEEWVCGNFHQINLATMTHCIEANELQRALDFDVNIHTFTPLPDEKAFYRGGKFDQLRVKLENAASGDFGGQEQQTLVNRIKDDWKDFLIYAIATISIAWPPGFVEDLEPDVKVENPEPGLEVEDLVAKVEDLDIVTFAEEPGNETTPPRSNYPSVRAPRRITTAYVKWTPQQLDFIGERLAVLQYQPNRYEVILQEGIANGLFTGLPITVKKLDARARSEYRRRSSSNLGGFFYAYGGL